MTGNAIVIDDNGGGIPAETVAGIVDYSTRTSSREAYCSPTRGAQGNALKTILAMAFASMASSGWAADLVGTTVADVATVFSAASAFRTLFDMSLQFRFVIFAAAGLRYIKVTAGQFDMNVG